MTYDYIILGCGASGLMMANEMAQDSFFENKQILIIDKEIKNKNDRTWSFWEKENIELQKIAFKNLKG